MSFIVIPTRSDIPNYEQRITLNGTQYVLSFRYNTRTDRWILDIKTSADEYIIMGIPILLGTGLIDRFVDDRLPPGYLFAINLEDEFAEGGAEDLGQNLLLIYEEA